MLGILLAIAVIQGLTEFLPVSSSGHLALAAYFFNFHTVDMLLFFLIVHAGTACAALYFFRADIIGIIRGMADIAVRKKTIEASEAFKWIMMIIMVSIPTAFTGILFKQAIESAGVSLIIVGLGLVGTSCLLMLTKFVKKGDLDLNNFGYRKAFLVGIAQSCALLPGISRSGSTISVALILGASPMFAGKLSFLASFVAIFGALLLEVIDAVQKGFVSFPLYYLVISFFVAFFVGLWALKFLIRILSHGKLYLFSLYCFTLGISVILYYIFYLSRL
ncbi:MAG: undecaprenyl-diphosphate phosphatase [Brevinemataceae bacterium]